MLSVLLVAGDDSIRDSLPSRGPPARPGVARLGEPVAEDVVPPVSTRLLSDEVGEYCISSCVPWSPPRVIAHVEARAARALEKRVLSGRDAQQRHITQVCTAARRPETRSGRFAVGDHRVDRRPTEHLDVAAQSPRPLDHELPC